MNVGSLLSTTLLDAIFESDAVLGGNEIVTEDLESPPVSILDRGLVLEDD